MSDVTRILLSIGRGENQAADQLLPLVYDELRMLASRNLAREKPGQTLQATDLVHEATGNLVTIALDTAAGKMYWSDTAAHTIHRANLDGSLIEDLITDPSSNIWGIALDVGAGKMYWTDVNQNRISRVDLDGSNTEVLWTGVSASSPNAITLDLAAGKMYCCDPGQDAWDRRSSRLGNGSPI